MKKLGLVIGAGVLLVVMVVAGAGLWIKGHTQEVARRMTGLDIHFATLDVHYAPMPLIVLTDLALNHGANSVRIPKLELYPDLGRVFRGEIRVKKAVLEEPLVIAKELGDDSVQASAAAPSGAAAFSLNAVPDGVVVVNRGRIVLQSAPPTLSSPLAQPFDADLIVGKPISARAFIKAFQFGESTRLQDIDLRLESANKRAVLHGTVRMCDVDLILEAVVLPPSRVVTALETKGTDVDLTSLVACFSNELPVYLSGRLFVRGNVAADGDSPQALIDGAQGEVTVVVKRASVQRLSGLDPRLGFFLDILRSARIGSETEDAISLSRSVFNANLQKGRLVLNRFSMIGPLLNAWGSGEFTLKDKHLKVSGGVKTALGVTSGLDIDRILEKEGT